MKLTALEIKPDSPYIDGIFHIMHTQFPEPEWEPEDQVMNLIANNGEAQLYGFLDNGDFIGMGYMLDYSEHPFAYVVYLGIRGNSQGKGYGTQALRYLCEKAGRPVALSIETTEALDAPNIQQRQKRRAFYERNGFRDSGARILDCGVSYIVMANDDVAISDIDAFAADFPRLVGRPH